MKVVNVVTNELSAVLGKVEHTERFLQCVLFQGKTKKRRAGAAEAIVDTNSGSADPTTNAGQEDSGNGTAVAKTQNQQLFSADPTLLCTSFKKHRFYLFSRREPEDSLSSDGVGRDVFNEKPTKEDALHTDLSGLSGKSALGREATIVTTFGDIRIQLFGKECPLTVENFCGLARKKYYDGKIIECRTFFGNMFYFWKFVISAMGMLVVFLCILTELLSIRGRILHEVKSRLFFETLLSAISKVWLFTA